MSQMELLGPSPATVDRPCEPIPGASYHPGFLTEDEAQALWLAIAAQPWLGDLARRVQHYGYRYDYQARRVTRDMYLGELPPFLRATSRRLFEDRWFRALPDQAIINEYLPGQGISAHVDCVPCFGDQIATISLGSSCEMEFARHHERQRHILEPRSILVLADAARFEWTHAIRARRSDHGRPRSRRISITFRTVIV
jgi:alkylated DNA repair dioxygenase AlkB